jgi:hypothetical protein
LFHCFQVSYWFFAVFTHTHRFLANALISFPSQEFIILFVISSSQACHQVVIHKAFCLLARLFATALIHSCSVVYHLTVIHFASKLSNCHTFQGLLFLAHFQAVHIELSSAIVRAIISGSTQYFSAEAFTISEVILVPLYFFIKASNHTV